MSASARQRSASGMGIFALEALDVLSALPFAAPVVALVRCIVQAAQAAQSNKTACATLSRQCCTVVQSVNVLIKSNSSACCELALASLKSTLGECLRLIESVGKKRAIFRIISSRKHAEEFRSMAEKLFADVLLLQNGVVIDNNLKLSKLLAECSDSAAADRTQLLAELKGELDADEKRLGRGAATITDMALLDLKRVKLEEFARESTAMPSPVAASAAPAPIDFASLAQITLLDVDIDELSARAVGDQVSGVIVVNGTWMGELVSIKRLTQQQGSVKAPASERDLFERGVKIAAMLRHPRIVTVFGYSFAHETAILVCEHAARGSLRDIAYKNDQPTPRRLQFAIDIANAVAYAHSRGVWHRALRASCCVVTDDWRAKLSDFARAKSTASQAGHIQTLAHPAAASGSDEEDQRWTAPEVLLDSTAVSASADVYSLGMVCFEIFCGKPPFTPTQFAEVIGAFVAKQSKVPDVDKLCIAREPMLQCWQFAPGARPSALDLAASLERVRANCAYSTRT
jgi:serine/threonine protein kinase